MPTAAPHDRIEGLILDWAGAILPPHDQPLEARPPSPDPSPGVFEALRQIRALGIRVANTSAPGPATRARLAELAAIRAPRPDATITPEQVARGQPAPYLAWRAAEAIGAWPHWCCAVVGDSVLDMQAGRNAGFWTIGLTLSGGLVGLSTGQLAALSAEDREARHRTAADTLRRAGAHLVLRSAAELPAAMATLNERLSRGDRP